MARKCSKKQSYIKSYRRSNGVKVKGHCSNKKGRRSSSRKQSKKKSKKLRCSPPKSQRIRSYKKSNGKRVKAHCSRPKRSFMRRFENLQAVGSVREMMPFEIILPPMPSVAPLVKQEEKVKEEEVKEEEVKEESKCDGLNQTECVQVLDENNLRRCRVNIQSKACEDLPLQYRQRATLQVGGSAEYIPFVAGERMKLSEEKLAPFRVDQEGRRFRQVMDQSEKLIQEGRRRRERI